MIIGERLRKLRKERKLSQGDIEERTGLLRCYVSRVETGYTVPALETLEKFARALEVPMYELFRDGGEPPKLPKTLKRKPANDGMWSSSKNEPTILAKFCRYFSQMNDSDLKLMLFTARKMVGGKKA